jgi:hypothetical protein
MIPSFFVCLFVYVSHSFSFYHYLYLFLHLSRVFLWGPGFFFQVRQTVFRLDRCMSFSLHYVLTDEHLFESGSLWSIAFCLLNNKVLHYSLSLFLSLYVLTTFALCSYLKMNHDSVFLCLFVCVCLSRFLSLSLLLSISASQ